MRGSFCLLVRVFDWVHQCLINIRFFVNVILIINSSCFVNASVFINVASVNTGPERVFLFDKALQSQVKGAPESEKLSYQRFSTVIKFYLVPCWILCCQLDNIFRVQQFIFYRVILLLRPINHVCLNKILYPFRRYILCFNYKFPCLVVIIQQSIIVSKSQQNSWWYNDFERLGLCNFGNVI